MPIIQREDWDVWNAYDTVKKCVLYNEKIN